MPRLLDVKQTAEQRGVRIDIHLTDDVAGEKGDSFAHGRPNLPAVIGSAFETLSGSLFIAGAFVRTCATEEAACGPQGFTRDVRNANAAGQLRIARGTSALSDVVLHTEVFEL